MKYEIPVMEKQGSGAIVNTASIYGLAGAAGYIAYNAAKHGVVGITRTAALEYATAGIRINAVCPGYIRTPMTQPGIDANPEFERKMVSQTPMGRMGMPEEIAEAVVWLCSDAASLRHRPHHDPRRRLHGPVARPCLANPSSPRPHPPILAFPTPQVLTSSRRVSPTTGGGGPLLDILIKNGLVVDGTGNPGFYAGVGVQGETVSVFRGDYSHIEALRTIDATGKVVCPGFIDMHAHTGLVILAEPEHHPKVRQGITTELVGVDGNSYAPFTSHDDFLDFVELNSGLDGAPPLPGRWSTVAEYLSMFDNKVAVNIAYVIGNSPIRICAMGWDES